MSRKMLAAVMSKPGIISMEKKGIPVPREKEVLVKIQHVGICGSDIHYYEHGHIGSFVIKKPIILGHESAGKIVKIGPNVKNHKVGDFVALEPGIPCGKCVYCKKGKYNLCPDVVFMATPPYDGAFVEYIAYPEDMVFNLPEGVGTLEGALIEPLCVGLHAVTQAKAVMGQSAVILGSGCIGLCTMMVLKAIGVTDIYMVDIIEKRLEKAKQICDVNIIKADEHDVNEKIKDFIGNHGVDMVFETAGSRITTQQTVGLVCKGGTIVLVGMAPDEIIEYNMGCLIAKEAQIKTVFRYRNLYPTAIKAVADGLIPLKEIVTNIFKFNEIHKAIEYNMKNKMDVVKVVISNK